jgi:SH3-like domain-containing protein
MKLGNRKVVIGGLTAVAFTSLTAFTNVTPGTTSDTNLISGTPSVLYQNLATAQCGGITNYSLDFSSLFTPGQVTVTLDSAVKSTSTSGTKSQVKAQAGIANMFTQSETLVALSTNSDTDNTELTKAALVNDNVGEEASDPAVETPQTVTTSGETLTAEAPEQQQDTSAQEVVTETPVETTTPVEATTEEVQSVSPQEVPVETQEITAPATDTETEAPAEESKWANKVMANVEESVNIRAEADEEAAVVGKLYKGAEADILEKGDVWTKISSGSVTEGYVKNEYLAFGDEAEALAAQDGTLVATVNTDALRIRSEASEDASVLDLAEKGAELTAISQDGDWVEIQYTSDSSAYVASEFVTVDYVLGKAVTIEEEEAMIAEKKRKEAEAKQAEIAASEDAALLAAVVKMEAGGESYEGKLAVASVVVNRMRSGAYPGSVSGVVYQAGQFPGASNGTLASILSNGVGGECKQAAVEALSGLTNVSYMHFNSVSRIGTNGYVIGNHCFY